MTFSVCDFGMLWNAFVSKSCQSCKTHNHSNNNNNKNIINKSNVNRSNCILAQSSRKSWAHWSTNILVVDLSVSSLKRIWLALSSLLADLSHHSLRSSQVENGSMFLSCLLMMWQTVPFAQDIWSTPCTHTRSSLSSGLSCSPGVSMIWMVFEVRKDALTCVFQIGHSSGFPLKSGTGVVVFLLMELCKWWFGCAGGSCAFEW